MDTCAFYNRYIYRCTVRCGVVFVRQNISLRLPTINHLFWFFSLSGCKIDGVNWCLTSFVDFCKE